MKFIKSIFTSSAFWVLVVMPIAAVSLIILTHDPVHQYTGRVISVDWWNGDAKLLTKTQTGKDTVLIVQKRKYECFVIDQTITVWTGGDLFDGIASTEPQN
jgi:hypothetical protein